MIPRDGVSGRKYCVPTPLPGNATDGLTMVGSETSRPGGHGDGILDCAPHRRVGLVKGENVAAHIARTATPFDPAVPLQQRGGPLQYELLPLPVAEDANAFNRWDRQARCNEVRRNAGRRQRSWQRNAR